MPRRDAIRLIETFQRDRTVWATAPCNHEFRLSESRMFYHSDLPPEGRLWIDHQEQALADLRKDVTELRRKLTTGFTERSVQVKLGKTVEKVIPALPGFPYARFDCRAIFDPIDYIAFVGLSRDRVTKVDFLDVKTGSARLSNVQREIRDAVVDGKVSLREFRP